MATPTSTVISCMLAVPDAPAAVEWYRRALGASVLWNMGSVAGLEIGGAAFFLHEPVKGRFASPKEIGTTTVRVELFVENPDEVIARAVAAGALAGNDPIKNHEMPVGNASPGRIYRPVWSCVAGRR